MVLSLVDMINGVEYSGFDFVFFLILLTIEKAISVYHSNHFLREFIPVDKELNTVFLIQHKMKAEKRTENGISSKYR